MRRNASSATSATQPSAISDFTLAAYRDLLQSFRRTHGFVSFADYDEGQLGKRLILLRHDIDYSIADALTMARLEADLGVRATYFLLFSAPTYNLLAAENIGAPRLLRELGHEVGLHYDVGALLNAGGDPRQILDAQARLLGELSGAEVTSIAMHNPSVSGVDIFRQAPYINAYADSFCKDIAYYSDSCMAWRDNFMAAHSANAFPARLQLLVHPCLWTEQRMSRRRKLQRIFAAVERELGLQQQSAQAIWASHAGAAEHDARESELTVLHKEAAG